MRILSTLFQWLIVFIILGILSAIGIVSFDSLDEWITPTNILLGFIIIILFMIWLNVEKINIRAKYEEEKAELKERLNGLYPEETSTKEQYTPYGRSVSDISQEEDNTTTAEDETIKDEDREKLTKERLSKLDQGKWNVVEKDGEKITKERLNKLDQGYWKSEDGTWKKKL